MCRILHLIENIDSFKRLAKETHPDRPNGNKEQFQKLQMAFKRALRTIEVIWIEMLKRQLLSKPQRKGGATGKPMHGLLRERDGYVEGEEGRR